VLTSSAPLMRAQVSLKDADISLRRRALDLLFAMCHPSNAEVCVVCLPLAGCCRAVIATPDLC
jgi:hypothetical protein